MDHEPLPRPPVYIPPGGPPQAGPSREIYALMGRENIYQMVEHFYVELEKSELRRWFPEDMRAASRKNAAFLMGVLGGPSLYAELYGPPMMRQRHLPFPIDEHARQVWLSCFKGVLEGAEEKYDFPAEHLAGFIEFLETFSAWMVNTKSDGDSPG
jgi:hemoglobin